MYLLSKIRQNAKKNTKRIVLPEATEERTLQAADKILFENICDLILLGDPETINKMAEKAQLENIRKARIINPLKNDQTDHYADLMVELRKHKGLTRDKALELLKDPLYLGPAMIKNGDADGEVAGAKNATADVLRPALQLIRTKPNIGVVSGAFVMILKDRHFGKNGIMVFADCAVNPDPNAEQLAEIAVASGETAKNIAGFEPVIAMLSFSTKGSAEHPMAEKVMEAACLAREKNSDLKIDGELQADAAIIESIAKKKAPDSEIAGKANVLIFPDLQSGNIAYKLVQRLAHAEAVGPILQGMAAPVNDLSRGCSVNDIINLVAITANQAISNA